jgi:tagatose-6-phosphate ketose/aldose isomerase
VNPLTELLNLSVTEKQRQGIVHTPQEIAQQPDTWTRTWAQLYSLLPQIQSFLAQAGISSQPEELLTNQPTIFLIGAGTSDYIGRCLHHLLRQKWQCEVIPVPSTSLLIDFQDLLLADRRYLWISFSRSGDSPEGVAVLERALSERPDIAHLIVTCNAAGAMLQRIENKRNCLGIVLAPESNDQGLAMTSSFTNMVLAGQILAHAWSPSEYETIFKAIVEAGQTFLPLAANTAAQLASRSYSRACFVGSGALAGTALEAALKLLELTAGRVKTMTQATLALRHGPMAALDHDTLFVSFLSTQNARQKYELDLLREIEQKQLARTTLAVAGCGLQPLPELKSTQLISPSQQWTIPDLYRPVLDILFGQLLGLFSSLHCGLTPDSPSPNGAISRVVQPIGIY